MKNRGLLLLVAIPLILSGCAHPQQESSSYEDDSSSSSSSSSTSSSLSPSSSSSSSSSGSSEDIPGEEDGIIVEMDPMIKTGEDVKPYQLSFQYEDEYFSNSAKTYNEDLSMLSYGATLATANKERGTKFFTDISFENITSHAYDSDPTKDSIGYFMAHKTIGNYELVTVAFRGYNYGLEWTNNFVIGKTADHEGFKARGEEVYQDLQSYIDTYAKNKTLKLWINGYSRGGALSNVLSSLILKGDKVSVLQDDMFVYTFEAPASLSVENAIAYENIHNITNKADIIASIPPESYGLKRCGVDHQIYDSNLSTLLKEFDEEIDLPAFAPVSAVGATNGDPEVLTFLLNQVFNKEEDPNLDPTIYSNTREQYVDNYQEGLSSAIGYIFALSSETRSELIAALKEQATDIIGDQTGEKLYLFIKDYLDKDNIRYEDEKLRSDCATLLKAVGNLFGMILIYYYLSSDFANDLTRLITMHFSETVYVLLRNYHSKEALD